MSLKNNAFATRKNYIRGVKALMLHYQRLPEDCSVDEIKAFLVYQQVQNGYSSSTVNLRVCALKYYFRFVVDRIDLVVKIPNPRIPKYETDILTFEELLQLRRSCRDMRQLLILHLLYDTGIRVRELIRLKVSDFDKYHQSITIRNSKGKQTRVVYYGDELRNILIRYVKARGGVPQNTLLESYKAKNQPLTIRGVQHILRQIAKRAGLLKKGGKRVHPHAIRHTFAVHYINAGGALPRLQKLLGHKDLTTTLHYLKHSQLPEGKKISVLDEMLKIVTQASSKK